jgi:hypothetical protein
MTLYSKANLTVAGMASGDQYDRHMNGVRFEADGTTVAANSRGLVAVSPSPEATFPDVGPRATPGGQGLFLRTALVESVSKNLPKDKGQQYAAMTQGRSVAKTEFTTVSRSGQEKRVADRPLREQFINWKEVVRTAREADPENVKLAEEGNPMRVCVNRKDLMQLLKVLEQACPDKGGDSPVFIEIGKGLVMRSRNRDTGQHAIGVAVPYRLKGQPWLEEGEWEMGVFGEEHKPLKRKRKVMRKRKVT